MPGLSAFDTMELAYHLVVMAADGKTSASRASSQSSSSRLAGATWTKAGEVINSYEVRNDVTPKRLEALRVEVGGPVALRSVIEVLSANLDCARRCDRLSSADLTRSSGYVRSRA